MHDKLKIILQHEIQRWMSIAEIAFLLIFHHQYFVGAVCRLLVLLTTFRAAECPIAPQTFYL